MLQLQHAAQQQARCSNTPQHHTRCTTPPQHAALTTSSSRRGLLLQTAGCIAVLTTPLAAAAAAAAAQASSQAAPPPQAEPACASCVGYVDGTLGACSGLSPCASSYDDTPVHFVAPWSYDGSSQAALQQLCSTLGDFGAHIQQQDTQTGYVYAVLEQGSGRGLDLEFVFAENDNTVALRAAQQVPAAGSSSSSSSASGAQAALKLPGNAVAGFLSQVGLTKDQPAQVLEEIRMQLGWEVVPVLRNRQRTLFFGESPWDTYGPVPPPVPDYSRDLLADF